MMRAKICGWMLLISMATVLPACSPGSEKSKSGDALPTISEATNPAATQPVAPIDEDTADAQDDPRAPAYLPLSRDLPLWRKTESVRVAEGGVGPLMSDVESEQLAAYQIERTSRARYTHQSGEMVAVTLIECRTVEDAFGILSAMCDSDAAVPLGQICRVDAANPHVLHCWQGRTYLRLESDVSERDGASAVEDLGASIVVRIPGEMPPDILLALPTKMSMPATQRIIRSFKNLRRVTVQSLDIAVPDEADVLFGLDGKTQFAMRSYTRTDLDKPCTIWVALYATPELAAAAYGRMEQVMDQDESAWGQLSMLPPQGCYIVGTFTRDQESRLHVMPGAAWRLPTE